MELARVCEAQGRSDDRIQAMTKAEELLVGLSGLDKSHMHAHGGALHTHTTALDDGHTHEHNGNTDDHSHTAAGDHDHASSVPDHGHSHEVGVEMGRFELEFHKDLDAALANGLHEYAIRPDNIDVNALLAGVASGIGQAFQQSSTTMSVSPLGATSTVEPGKQFEAGFGTGVGKALDRLAQYYLFLLYKFPRPRDRTRFRMPFSACKKKNFKSVTLLLLSRY